MCLWNKWERKTQERANCKNVWWCFVKQYNLYTLNRYTTARERVHNAEHHCTAVHRTVHCTHDTVGGGREYFLVFKLNVWMKDVCTVYRATANILYSLPVFVLAQHCVWYFSSFFYIFLCVSNFVAFVTYHNFISSYISSSAAATAAGRFSYSIAITP